MKNAVKPEKVFKITVIVSIICVILLTATAAVVSYLIASDQNKAASKDQPETSDMYETSALLLLNTGAGNGSPLSSNSDKSDKVELSDPESDKAMANTVAQLLLVAPEAKPIIKSAEITVEPVEDTYFIRITASSKDPHTAANSANQMADTGCNIYRKYFDSGKLMIAEEASVPSQPIVIRNDSPEEVNVMPTVLIATLAALSASMMIGIILTAVVYTTYKKKYYRKLVESDLEYQFNQA